ncbi:MAG TPA: RidA family protein [Armatimonadota bacterium]|nr:RidA family protein [Armatimonadota bacterium]
MGIEDRLREMGVTLPEPAAPVAAYVPCVRTGSLVFVSGQIPRRAGLLLYPGKLGAEVTVEQGQEAARAAVINALAALKAEVGSLDRVRRIVRLNGFVAAAPDFPDHSKVIDGASVFLQQVFGEAGKHSRIAVGMASLPLNAPVEIDLIVELEPGS